MRFVATFTSQRSSASQEPQDAFVEVQLWPNLVQLIYLLLTGHTLAAHATPSDIRSPTTLQDIIARLLALARAEDKGVRLRTCQLLQLVINNQVLQPEGALCKAPDKSAEKRQPGPDEEYTRRHESESCIMSFTGVHDGIAAKVLLSLPTVTTEANVAGLQSHRTPPDCTFQTSSCIQHQQRGACRAAKRAARGAL